MQIVGLENYDYSKSVKKEYFEGIVIDQKQGVTLNISTKPKIGFYEFNIILPNRKNINRMADYIQIMVRFLLHDFHKDLTSYNLFFYLVDDQIMVKIVPRFPVSPFYVGYSIPQVPNQLELTREKIRSLYFK
jgi:hypothetical protein